LLGSKTNKGRVAKKTLYPQGDACKSLIGNKNHRENIDRARPRATFEVTINRYGAKIIMVGIKNKVTFDLIRLTAPNKYGCIELFITIFYMPHAEKISPITWK
jgi:hypothetical protein